MSSTSNGILITGANKGIGRAAVAAVLSSNDDSHVFLGARSAERGKAAREALIAESPAWSERLEVLEIDVSRADSVAQAAERVAGRFGGDEGTVLPFFHSLGSSRVSGSAARRTSIGSRNPRGRVERIEETNGRLDFFCIYTQQIPNIADTYVCHDLPDIQLLGRLLT